MDREQFEALLEEAFEAGYNSALEEIFDEDTDYESPYEDLYAYDEAWNPSIPKSKKAEKALKASGDGFNNLGKNKADFFRNRILPRIGYSLNRGATYGDMIKEFDKEKKEADKYYKKGHAADQAVEYAHRVGRYLSRKAVTAARKKGTIDPHLDRAIDYEDDKHRTVREKLNARKALDERRFQRS